MNIGDIFLSVRADLSQFQASLAGLNSQVSRSATNMGKDLMKVGAGMSSTGMSLTRNLTLPLLAAGGAATKFALDFDTTMRKTVALSDVTAEQIGGIRTQLLAMASEVGRGPQDLAEAFYFVASAGFKADEAMKVLEISAKASAAGMGTTQDVARVLGAAINAYGHENLTAAVAADELTAAVTDGSAEAGDYVAVLGRVVPAASALGVSFDQVVAAVAGMTNIGLSAEEATVGLNQVFISLLKPTSDAAAAMEEMGLSAAGLRTELREKGLLATLRTLDERFGSNEEASARVFGNVRALRTVTGLLALDTDQLNKIFGDTANSLGSLSQAYEDTEGPQRRIDRAMASLQASAISLGEDVLPQVVDVLESVTDGIKRLSRWWKDLDTDTRKNIIQWLAWVAVAGPALLIMGKLVSGLGALLRAVGFLMGAKGIPALIGGVSKARLVMGLWVVGILAVTEALQAASGPISDFFDELINGKKANKTLHELNDLTGDMMKAQVLRAMGIDAKEFAQAVEKAGGDVEYAFNAIKDAGGDLGKALVQLWADSDEATGGMVSGFGRNLKEARAAVRAEGEGIVTDLTATLVDGQFVVEPAAEVMVDPVAEAVAQAKQDVADAANDLIHTLASVLSSDPQELDDAAKEMWDHILHPYPDIKRRAKIEAILAAGWIADGLRSSDSRVQNETAEYVKGLLAEYDLMAPGALAAGELVNPALEHGISSNLAALTTFLANEVLPDIKNPFDLAEELERLGYADLGGFVRGMQVSRNGPFTHELTEYQRKIHEKLDINLFTTGYNVGYSYGSGLYEAGGYVGDAAQFLKNKVSGVMSFQGSPPFTHSRWIGEQVGETWGQGIAASVRSLLPNLASAVGSVASTLTAQPMSFATAAAPSATPVSASQTGGLADMPPAGAGVTNYNLNVTGRLPMEDAQDAIWELRRLAGIKKQ